MKTRNIVVGTIAYTLSTFTLAIVWHIVLFKSLYVSFGYFTGEPNIALGFLTIAIQGFVLSALYPLVKVTGTSIVRGLKFAAIVGVFFWTSHVLAFVAKQAVPDPLLFVFMESGYLCLQFGIYGALIGAIYSWGEGAAKQVGAANI